MISSDRAPLSGSVVVVTYRGAAHVLGLFASLHAHAPDVPVIVVDNASDDATAELVRTHAPLATLLLQERNLGYAGGANAGIREAARRGAAWVLLLNQDTVLTPGAVGALAAALARHPEAAAVQPLIMRPDGRCNSVGNPLHYLGFSFAGGNGLRVEEVEHDPALPWMHDGNWREAVEIPVASGAAVMFRIDALRSCGIFEPELYLYHEDYELSFRLRAAGWRLLLVGAASVIHDYSFTRNPNKWYHLERNRHWVLLAHLRWRSLAVLAAPLLAAEAAVWARAAREGWLREKLRSYLYWLAEGRVRYVLRRRRRFSGLRRLSDAELLRVATTHTVTAGGEAAHGFSDRVSAWFWRVLRPLLR